MCIDRFNDSLTLLSDLFSTTINPSISDFFVILHVHARARGYVIGAGVHIYIYMYIYVCVFVVQKKFESYFSD